MSDAVMPNFDAATKDKIDRLARWSHATGQLYERSQKTLNQLIADGADDKAVYGVAYRGAKFFTAQAKRLGELNKIILTKHEPSEIVRVSESLVWSWGDSIAPRISVYFDETPDDALAALDARMSDFNGMVNLDWENNR